MCSWKIHLLSLPVFSSPLKHFCRTDATQTDSFAYILFNLENLKLCNLNLGNSISKAWEDRYSHAILIPWGINFSNFKIFGVYKQHNSGLFHQLPRSPSHAKNSHPGQEVLTRPRSPSQAKKSQ